MFTFFGLLAIAVFAVAVLPVPRVRRLMLTGVSRLSQGALLALLGTCGTFLVRPDAAPDWANSAIAPLVEGMQNLLPASDPLPAGVPWFAVALVASVSVLPILIVLELAVKLSQQTALVQTLQKELRQVAAWVDSRLFALGSSRNEPPLAQEAFAAAEALRGTAQPHTPRPCVLDLMQ